jgi:hypothetical protein
LLGTLSNEATMHGVHIFTKFRTDAGEAELQQVLCGVVGNGLIATLSQEIPKEIVAYQILGLN